MFLTGNALDTVFVSPQGSMTDHPSLDMADPRTGIPYLVMATVKGRTVVVVGGVVVVVP